MITEQQPSSICEGLFNLVNTSSTQEMCRVEKNKSTALCEAVTCNTSDWVMVMSFNSCQQKVTLSLTNLASNNSFSLIISFSEYVQKFNHTITNKAGSVCLTPRVVSDHGKFYFLAELESSLLNLSFPVTPVPVACSQEGRSQIYIQ